MPFLNESAPAPYWGGGRGTLSMPFPLVALIKKGNKKTICIQHFQGSKNLCVV
jgi:hypothetical protein